jgi:hypothetical protein
VVLAFIDDIARCSKAAGLKTATIAYDCIAEYLNCAAIDVRAYEEFGQHLQLVQLMPINGVLAMDDAAIMQALSQSCFVVLAGDLTRSPSVYPFNKQMMAMQPTLRAFCEKELVLIKRYSLTDTTVELYMRPWIAFHGNDGPWITNKGLTLTGWSAMLRKCPAIELRGKIDLDLLGSVPRPRISLKSGTRYSTLPASLDVAEGQYRLRFSIPPDLLTEDEVEIQVAFDLYFLPKHLGLNEDTRRLVMHTPEDIKVSP